MRCKNNIARRINMRSHNNIRHGQMSFTHDSSSTHSLTVRQLNPRRGKNLWTAACISPTFEGGIGRTRPPLCISVTLAERVHFSKSTAFAHGGLIVCVYRVHPVRASACVSANTDRAGQAAAGRRFRLARERDPMEMDGRSRGMVMVPRTSATSALPPARIPGYNSAAGAALGLALDGPPADSTLCHPALWPEIRMSLLDLAHMAPLDA